MCVTGGQAWLYRHAVAAEYVTFISPCAPKGLSILAAIAPRLPQVRFLCVATAWTNAVVQHILKRFPNVVVEAGAPDVDVFYRRTKVLLVPSIWPEAFGLVATEAAARGIPVRGNQAVSWILRDVAWGA